MKKFLIALIILTFSVSVAYAFFDALTTATSVSINVGEWTPLEPILAYETGFENASAEEGSLNSYAASVMASDGVLWALDNTLRGSQNNDKKVDDFSLRGRSTGSAEILRTYQGLSIIEFDFARFGNDSGGVLSVEVSVDDGAMWTEVWSQNTTSVNALETVQIELDYDALGFDQNDFFRVRWLFSGQNNRRMNLDEVRLFVFGQRTVTLSTDEVGVTLSKDPDILAYQFGDIITISAQPLLGLNFIHWFDLDNDLIFSTLNDVSITIERDLNLEAVFVNDHAYSRIYYTDFDAFKGAYAPGTLSLDGVSWMFYNAVTGTLANDKTDVGRAARLTVNRNNVPDENDPLYDAHADYRGFIQPTSAFSNVARIDFTAAVFGNDSGVTMKLEISINGVDWVLIQDDFILTEELQRFVVVLNYEDYAGISENDDIFIRITNTSDEHPSDNIRRLNIDEFEIFELIP